MKTIKQNLTAVNNAEYQHKNVENKTNSYTEEYKAKTLEILENPNTTFSEFIDEQSKATDIARLGWLKPWAMLPEQLKYVFWWLQSFKNTEKQEPVNNWINSAPKFDDKYVLWLWRVAA